MLFIVTAVKNSGDVFVPVGAVIGSVFPSLQMGAVLVVMFSFHLSVHHHRLFFFFWGSGW